MNDLAAVGDDYSYAGYAILILVLRNEAINCVRLQPPRVSFLRRRTGAVRESYDQQRRDDS
jgi:hypothetical protein